MTDAKTAAAELLDRVRAVGCWGVTVQARVEQWLAKHDADVLLNHELYLREIGWEDADEITAFAQAVREQCVNCLGGRFIEHRAQIIKEFAQDAAMRIRALPLPAAGPQLSARRTAIKARILEAAEEESKTRLASHDELIRAEIADEFYHALGLEGGEYDIAGTGPWAPANLMRRVRLAARLDEIKQIQAHLEYPSSVLDSREAELEAQLAHKGGETK